MAMSELPLYKFLDAAGACPVTGHAWPTPEGRAPGAWIERAGEFDPAGLGFLVFRGDDLAPWATSQLYRVEAAGELREEAGAVCVERVRLSAPEPRWPEIARALVAASHDRTRALLAQHVRLAEYASDMAACVEHGIINGVLFMSALLHGRSADRGGDDRQAQKAAFLNERAWQSRFIAERLAGPYAAVAGDSV